MRRSLLAFAVVLVSSACHHAAVPLATTPSGVPTVQRTHENLNAVLWMQTAAEYRACTLEAYRLARLQLDAALADPRWSAAIEQDESSSGLPPAVVLDLDETVLDNSAFQARQVKDAAAYSERAWNVWVEERKAAAIPGAVEFLQYATARGVTPVYVTNRDHDVEDATRDVLARLGIPVASDRDVVLTRHENGWDASDKSARRSFVASRFRILLLVGDNLEDFAPGTHASVPERAALMQKYDAYWGTKWIMLPNPTYGSWESAVTAGAPAGDPAAALARKYAALRVDRP